MQKNLSAFLHSREFRRSPAVETRIHGVLCNPLNSEVMKSWRGYSCAEAYQGNLSCKLVRSFLRPVSSLCCYHSQHNNSKYTGMRTLSGFMTAVCNQASLL